MSRVNERASWLVLAYRVPGETARLRVSVWRRLKAAGAVYLANSVAGGADLCRWCRASL